MCCGTSFLPSHDTFIFVFRCCLNRFLGTRAKTSPLRNEWVELSIRVSVGYVIDVIEFLVLALHICKDYLRIQTIYALAVSAYFILWMLSWATLLWNARLEYKKDRGRIKCCKISVYCWRIIFKIISVLNSVLMLAAGVLSNCFMAKKGMVLVVVAMVIVILDIVLGLIYIIVQLCCMGCRSCPCCGGDDDEETSDKPRDKKSQGKGDMEISTIAN